MTTKKRLAICISGQTRIYNKSWEHFHRQLDEFFGDEYEYDLYGHTWNNCPHSNELTSEQNEKFTHFHTTSNLDIWNEWIKHDIFSTTPFKSSWNNIPEWQEFISGNDSGIIEFIKQRAIGGWAQIWSFNEAVENVPQQYDGLVRYRWDTWVVDDADVTKATKNEIRHFLNKTGDFHQTPGRCLSMGPQLIDILYMQDTFMVFDQEGMKKLITASNDFLVTLDKCVQQKEYINAPSAHELWAIYLKSCGIKIVAGMPTCVNMIEYDQKENKKWSI